ncbi:MAG: TolC family protein, partial [Desulfobacca sp.]|uniref:TolC family protein n=1 Tax=Desulfobacca sp. TaxID=2067990 RepID=UPI00404AA73A
MTKIVAVILGLLLLVWSFAAGPPSRPVCAARLLTLAEAVRLALDHDPETKNAKRSIKIAETRRSQAKRRYLPKVDIGLTNSPQVDYFGQPVINKMLWNSFVAMDQPLYAGGTIRNSVRLAESEIRRQGYEYAIYYQRTTTEATRAYFQTLSSQGAVEQYEALQKKSEEELQEAETRLRSGLISRFELLEAGNRLLDIRQKLSKARADHQVNMANLRKILGLEGDESLRLLDEMPIADISPEFDLLVSEAKTKRPELRYITEDVKYNQLRTDIERGKQRPQFSLVAGHEWQSPQVFEINKNFYFMLK